MRRTGSISIRTGPAVLTLLLAGSACTGGALSEEQRTAASAEIESMLHASAQAWNRGDLDGFLDDYADTASFVGAGGVIRGTDAIRDRYIRGYWSDGGPPDSLEFSDIGVRLGSPDFASVLGRYRLVERSTGEDAGNGYFTLLVARTDSGWKIIHDHSSAVNMP